MGANIVAIPELPQVVIASDHYPEHIFATATGWSLGLKTTPVQHLSTPDHSRYKDQAHAAGALDSVCLTPGSHAPVIREREICVWSVFGPRHPVRQCCFGWRGMVCGC